jgi:hypothetical protein
MFGCKFRIFDSLEGGGHEAGCMKPGTLAKTA